MNDNNVFAFDPARKKERTDKEIRDGKYEIAKARRKEAAKKQRDKDNAEIIARIKRDKPVDPGPTRQ